MSDSFLYLKQTAEESLLSFGLAVEIEYSSVLEHLRFYQTTSNMCSKTVT